MNVSLKRRGADSLAQRQSQSWFRRCSLLSTQTQKPLSGSYSLQPSLPLLPVTFYWRRLATAGLWAWYWTWYEAVEVARSQKSHLPSFGVLASGKISTPCPAARLSTFIDNSLSASSHIMLQLYFEVLSMVDWLEFVFHIIIFHLCTQPYQLLLSASFNKMRLKWPFLLFPFLCKAFNLYILWDLGG